MDEPIGNRRLTGKCYFDMGLLESANRLALRALGARWDVPLSASAR